MGSVAKSRQTLCNPWTVARQAPLSLGFSSQEDWPELPCCSPGDLPKLGIKPASPVLQVDSFTHRDTWEAPDGIEAVSK